MGLHLRDLSLKYKFWALNAVSFAITLLLVLFAMHQEQDARGTAARQQAQAQAELLARWPAGTALPASDRVLVYAPDGQPRRNGAPLPLSRQSGWTASGRANVNWQATPKDFFQLNGNLTGKRLTPQGYQEPVGILNFGYRHKVNDDWSFVVVGRDLLDSYKSTLVLDTATVKRRAETRAHFRTLMVGLTYSFGSNRRVQPQAFDYGSQGGAPQ